MLRRKENLIGSYFFTLNVLMVKLLTGGGN